MRAEFEKIACADGSFTLRGLKDGQSMHSEVGPAIEARAIFIEPLKVRELLQPAMPHGSRALVVHDIGLGIAGNALAAIDSRPEGGRSLHLISFEQEITGLREALDDPEGFPRQNAHRRKLTLLLRDGLYEESGLRWELRLGAYESAYPELAPADLHFLDFYSPAHQPEAWGYEIAQLIAARSTAAAALATYSAATSVRAALLLAGFFVAEGPGTSLKKSTTLASFDPARIGTLLALDWLAHWDRSGKPLPDDFPWGLHEARDRLRAHPQFA